MKPGDEQYDILSKAFQSWVKTANVQVPPDDWDIWFSCWVNGYNAGLFGAKTMILSMGNVPLVVIAGLDRLVADKE